jgi:HNH endonuclease
LRTGCISETGLAVADLNGKVFQRFAKRCGYPDGNGCIPWLGYKNYRGYGVFRIGGKDSIRTSAHRISWVLVNGDLPAGLLVLHKCDNPSCVNAEHLFLGSPADNTADMVSKKRHMWRNKLPWQKLTGGDIETVLELRRSGHTQQYVADQLGVSRPLISLIESGKIQYAARAMA